MDHFYYDNSYTQRFLVVWWRSHLGVGVFFKSKIAYLHYHASFCFLCSMRLWNDQFLLGEEGEKGKGGIQGHPASRSRRPAIEDPGNHEMAQELKYSWGEGVAVHRLEISTSKERMLPWWCWEICYVWIFDEAQCLNPFGSFFLFLKQLNWMRSELLEVLVYLWTWVARDQPGMNLRDFLKVFQGNFFLGKSEKRAAPNKSTAK